MNFATFAIVCFSCFVLMDTTVGNTVTVSLSTQRPKTGDLLELTCLWNPTSGANINTVNWFLGNDTTGLQLYESTCSPIGGPAPLYDLKRYSFSCSSSSNNFKMTIKKLQSSDDEQCWSCSLAFSNCPETARASSACIMLQDYLLQSQWFILSVFIQLLNMLVVPFFICLMCCGCLDCFTYCRIFYHYDYYMACHVTWYCKKKPCCIFFCCRAEEKRGRISYMWPYYLCCESGKEFCGGCHFFRSICTCGWPDCCTSDKMRSCGCCYCICCVKEESDLYIS